MARPHSALIELASLRPIHAVTDFEELLRSAVEHRMVGLLYREIETGRVSGPLDWRQLVAVLHLQSAERGNRQGNAASCILAALGEIGVEAALFKGIAAEVRWYEGIGDRPSSDIDIFIPPQHRDRAHDILAAVNPQDPLRNEVQGLVEREIIQSVTTLHASGIWVDIHFDPFKVGTPLLRGDEIWERTVAVELPGGMSCRALDAESSLIQFLVHLNRNRFADLLGYADVVRILNCSAIDWGFVEQLAVAQGIDTHVYLSLETVLADLNLPQLRPRCSGWRAIAWRSLWPKRIRLLGEETRLRWRRRSYFLPFFSTGSKRGVLKWLWYQAFPPAQLAHHIYAGEANGPYLWRLVAARTQRVRGRIRRVRQLRRTNRDPRR